MNKERLEEITSSVGILLSGDRHVLLRRKHYEWLIEQAERVNELETTVDFYQSALRDADRRVQELERQIKVIEAVQAVDRKMLHKRSKQNKRYREALEEIIKEGTLTNGLTGKTGYKNGAKIARQALESEK